MTKRKTLKEKFNAIKNINKERDWNDEIFRDTITTAFRYCAEKHYKEF